MHAYPPVLAFVPMSSSIMLLVVCIRLKRPSLLHIFLCIIHSRHLLTIHEGLFWEHRPYFDFQFVVLSVVALQHTNQCM
jgi:hypothetical protein